MRNISMLACGSLILVASVSHAQDKKPAQKGDDTKRAPAWSPRSFADLKAELEKDGWKDDGPDGPLKFLDDFSQGPQLPDPKRLLRGSGKQTRFIQVEAASQLAHPDVEALIAATIDQARVPLPSEGKGSLIIKSGGAKKPPRRKPSK